MPLLVAPPPVAALLLLPLPVLPTVSEHADVHEAASTGLPPLPAFAAPGPGRHDGGTAKLLDLVVDKAAEGDVAGKPGPVGPWDGGEGLHQPGVDPSVAAGVGDTAQVEREGLEVFSDQSRQPGPVRQAIGDHKVLRNVVVKDRSPRAKGSAERIQASARPLEVHAILWEPTGRDRNERVG